MTLWWETILAPVRERARIANASLLEKLGISEEEIDAIDWGCVDRNDPGVQRLGRVTAIAAIRGATRA